jgi:3-oxoacyl-[acyl-carrier protein] reductase
MEKLKKPRYLVDHTEGGKKMKKALVTGATGGIGQAIAQRLCRDGYFVILNYVHAAGTASALCGSLNAGCIEPQAEAFRADISDRSQAEEMFHAIGGIDVLVNNAGIAQQKLFTELTEDDWQHMIAVDVTGVFHCCQFALPHMIREKRGKIVNISSMWGQVGASCEAAYSAAKAAVIGLTKALAKEEGPSGIQVNCIAPGVIDTPMNAALGTETLQSLADDTPLGRLGTPEDIADAVGFLVSPQADFITGQVLGVNGGFVI